MSGAAPNAFSRALALLRANPLLLVPALIIGIVAGIAGGALAPPAAPVDTSDPTSLVAAQAGTRYLGTAIVWGVTLVAGVLIDALTIGMAGAAWDRGRTTFADLGASLRTHGPRLIATVLVYALADVVLAVLTFGLGALVFGFFALYVFAGVALGDRSFADALRASVMITARRFASSLVLVVLLFAVAIVLSVGAAVIPFPPHAGALAAILAVALLRAYANLVIAGEYRLSQGALAASPKRTAP